MRYLFILLALMGCGQEDHQKQKCVLYGEECNDPHKDSSGEPTVVYQPVPGEAGPRGQAGYNTIMTLTKDNNCVIFIAALDVNRNLVIDSEDFDYQTAEVCDGQDGVNGTDGQDGVDGMDGQDASGPVEFAVTEMIDPCNDAPGIYDEILLKLGSGKIIASFSDNAAGMNTRFSVIPDGNYRTTDGSNCYFTVSNNNIINEHY